MSCLLFLYGEKRTFDTAIKTWNILDIPNLDIVVHTPNTSSHYLGNKEFDLVTEDDFSELKKSKIYFYDRYDYQKTDLHVLHYSYRFLAEYLKKSKKYKYIFIGRLDSTFYVKDYQSLIQKNEDILYTHGDVVYENNQPIFIADHVFFGNHNVIEKFVSELPPKEELERSHTDMAIYIDKMKFLTKNWNNFSSLHIRPNMVGIFKEYFSKNNIKNDDLNYEFFINTNKDLFIELNFLYKQNE